MEWFGEVEQSYVSAIRGGLISGLSTFQQSVVFRTKTTSEVEHYVLASSQRGFEEISKENIEVIDKQGGEWRRNTMRMSKFSRSCSWEIRLGAVLGSCRAGGFYG